MAFLDDTASTTNNDSVRRTQSPLWRLAEDSDGALLFVRDLNSTGEKAVYHGDIPVGIIGACRSAWLIGKHPFEPRQPVLTLIKKNVAESRSGCRRWSRYAEQ